MARLRFAHSEGAKTGRAGLVAALGLALLAAGCVSSSVDRSKDAEAVIERTTETCKFVPDLTAVIALRKGSAGRSSDELVRSICNAVEQVPPDQAAAASRSLTVVVHGQKVPGRMER